MPDEIDLSAGLESPSPKPRRIRPTAPHLNELSQFAKENGLAVGSTTGGRHNAGSLHYSGNAIDIKGSGAFDDNRVSELSRAASERGLKLRDERRHPAGQKVWGGPHIHLEYAGNEQQPSSQIDLSAGLEDAPAKPTPRTGRQSAISRRTSRPIPSPQTIDAGAGYSTPAGVGLPSGSSYDVNKILTDARRTRPQTFDEDRVSRIPRPRNLRQAEDAEMAQRKRIEADAQNYTPSIFETKNPDDIVTERITKENQQIADAQQAQREAQARFATPEMTTQRKEFGAVGVPIRSVTAPAARAGAGLLKTLGGVTSALGIAPNRLSEYLNHRGQVLEEASNAPLDEAGNEIVRGLPEKLVSSLGDVGFGVAEIIALKRIAPSMSLSQILGVETALKTSDKPLRERTEAVTKSALMGKLLDQHLSRTVSAAAFGVPTALETGAAYSKGNMSAEDALLETGVQAGTGFLMGGKPKGETNAKQAETQRQGVQAEQPTEGSARAPMVEGVLPEVRGSDITERAGSSIPEVQHQRFQHVDFGEVKTTLSQEGARAGRLRVAEVNDPTKIHYIKKTTARGAGNERAVPLKPVEPEIDLQSGLERPIASRQEDQLSLQPAAEPEAVKPTEGEAGKEIPVNQSQELSIPPIESRKVESAANAAKEPWQMTRDEYNVLQSGKGKPGRLENAAGRKTEWGGMVDGWRRAEVEQAIAEGKSVPQEVLADYPDLATRAARSTGSGEATGNAVPRSSETKSELSPASGEGDRAGGKGTSLQGEPPAPESQTAVKNASMQADRVALDLPELAQAEPRKAAEVHEKAITANTKDPHQVDRLTEQALQGDKNFTDVETAQVRLRAQEIKNRTNELLREIDATDDPVKIKEKRLELESLTNEFDRLSQATKAAGTEWGRAGVARQQAIDQDFNLVAMKARLKADKGAPLTEKETAKIEDIDRRLRAAEERADKSEQRAIEAEQRAIQAELQQQVEKVSRQRKRTETKEYLDQEVVVIRANIAAELARLKSGNIHASGLAGIDPEGRLTKELIKYVHNRAKANVGLKAEALIDEAHDLVKDLGVSRRQVAEALVGYGNEAKKQTDTQKRIGEISREINSLLKAEDVQAGRRSSRQEGPQGEYRKNQTRLKQLEQQQAELQRKIDQQDFSETPKREGPRYTRETLAASKEVERIKAEYNRMRYKATRSTGGKISDELAKAASVPKTLKSIGDISAVFRQGGFYSLTHPITGFARPFGEMVRSFSDLGWRNVEAKIKADKDFETLRDAGVEFTGVDKSDPHLSHHEEGYLGKEYLDYVPVAKQVADFSERTFVSFLDAQRLSIGNQMLEGLTEAQRRNPAELKAIAELINAGTGRGNLGKRGNAIAPALNIAMFSPRLLASRVQLLNNMVSPRKLYTMPAGARKAMIKDNVKFLAATGAMIGLVKAAGGKVSLDPDDSEFLKIRFGDTVYDQLTGLQQPLRFIINMARAGSPIDSQRLQAGKYYAGKSMKEQVDPFEPGSFTRSKLNPALSPLVNYATGSDYLGRKFSAARELKEGVLPLPFADVYEGLKQGGVIGALKATPTFTGIGVGSYPEAAEKPKNLAEKMARRLVSDKMPDTAREDEQIETDQKKSELRARSRRGEDVSKDLEALKGKITERQIKGILGARNKTRLQEDTNRLGIKDALLVYKVADPSQRAELKDMVVKKMKLIDTMLPDAQIPVRALAAELGITGGSQRPTRAERPERAERATRQ